MDVHGWVANMDERKKSIFVDIIINDRIISTLKADKFREDLIKVDIGDGKKSFTFNPKTHLEKAINVIRICYSGTEQIVSNGKATIMNSSIPISAKNKDDSRGFDEMFTVSQDRWKGDEEDQNLTWGRMMTGDSFFEVVNNYYSLSDNELIFEIGPGYGRLLKTILDNNLPFNKFLGIELSQNRVDRLNEAFGNEESGFLVRG